MEPDLEMADFRPFGCLTSHILGKCSWLFRWKRTAYPNLREEFEREIAGDAEPAADLSRSTRARSDPGSLACRKSLGSREEFLNARVDPVITASLKRSEPSAQVRHERRPLCARCARATAVPSTRGPGRSGRAPENSGSFSPGSPAAPASATGAATSTSSSTRSAGCARA